MSNNVQDVHLVVGVIISPFTKRLPLFKEIEYFLTTTAYESTSEVDVLIEAL